MRGTIPPLSQHVFMAWYLVKHRDDFNFTLIDPIDFNLRIRGPDHFNPREGNSQ
jgi:hypothetical protein